MGQGVCGGLISCSPLAAAPWVPPGLTDTPQEARAGGVLFLDWGAGAYPGGPARPASKTEKLEGR